MAWSLGGTHLMWVGFEFECFVFIVSLELFHQCPRVTTCTQLTNTFFLQNVRLDISSVISLLSDRDQYFSITKSLLPKGG